ncbi:hypothetical protein C9E81_20695 [Paracoccus alkanivorans]|uniref:Uncharacterized protein n=1 Tax=Paracoccus alkanivorans TaxID=2116655 RepID=A0A3M0M167_9RHOB|nr:hypothetical protein C9E81_20695 [Paracoccus alkanivorans]
MAAFNEGCSESGRKGLVRTYGKIEALGYDCAVIAPSLIPHQPDECVKTSRRDAVKLARV